MIPRSWLVGLACCVVSACQLPWSAREAIEPGLRALDRDNDGHLNAEELQRGSSVAVYLAALDIDGSGAVGPDELLEEIRTTDPLVFDDARSPTAPRVEDRASLLPDPREQRCIRELFEFMVSEIHRLSPSQAVPSAARIQQAAETGSLGSPQSAEVAAELSEIYRDLHLLVPPVMRGLHPDRNPGVGQGR